MLLVHDGAHRAFRQILLLVDCAPSLERVLPILETEPGDHSAPAAV